MSIALKLRNFTRPIVQATRITASSFVRMQSTNQHGQGASHATGHSKVPGKVQEAAPQGLEEALPDKLHPTGAEPGQSTHKTHAKDDGNASIVPKKVQEKLPESIERAVPNVIHDTGSKK
ncbi:uncharacterized protein B0T15DRAFT_481539 [Chaetomium strumarium]|uniref:Uncharacterized protein n=1 Tax=Chaetomium strumarium TaxID=1170767 RepID=A0AAJ0H1G7_9PEZI|nr:hypothetical protein B0T15DRAFT_481539 [Chaetomium strumarium]